MDPILNPYAPGAGTRPPELVGRDEVREEARIALERTRLGRASKSILLVGLRGAGKTVLLNSIQDAAEGNKVYALNIEGNEHRSLPAMLAPQLRVALLRLAHTERARELANRALRGLAGFVNALKLKYQDIEVGLDFSAEPGLANSGDMEADLQDLIEAVGTAASADESCIAMFIDELQYVKTSELAALITALHRAAQRQLPIILIGAGLPQARGNVGRAKTYAERLFSFSEIGALSIEDSKRAIAKPASELGVHIQAEVLDYIVKQTQGYAYFLQVWGKHLWDAAERSPIGMAEAEVASIRSTADLDASFFLVRFERLTPNEKVYLRGMAELGAGPHRSGDIASELNRSVSSIAPIRNQLIEKGMIWSPAHGDTAFTVPLFDEFMKRIMPE